MKNPIQGRFFTIFIIVFSILSVKCTKQGFINFESGDKLFSHGVKPNIYQGPCPYDCEDARCKYYSEPNPNCIIGGEDPNPIGDERICGSEFSIFGLQGKTIRQAVDSVGDWHNKFQISLLQELQKRNINLETDTIQNFLKHFTDSIMAVKGINHNTLNIPNLDIEDSTRDFSSFSGTAQLVLIQAFSLVDEYSTDAHSYYINELNKLKTQALNLSSFNEAVKVGIGISTAINSLSYWKANANSWLIYLSGSNKKSTQPCNVNLRKLAGSDAKGAVTGAVNGVGGGVAGAVAGGILGGAIYSSGNILNQALNCQPGVVGRVSRWLSSWF